MIGYLKLGGLIAAGLALVGLVIGAYLVGRGNGKEIVQGKWDAEKVVAGQAFQKAVADKETAEGRYRTLQQEIENDIKPKLVDATTRGDDLARRLSDHQKRARDCSVREPTGTTGEPPSSSREPSDGEAVERAVAEHFGACARDAERLNGWNAWWDRVELPQ